ncbi:MarR family transcriptional regulator [Altererythrobacter xixiisoli]|uniref:MarR family transcriptional regulator n=1 Tax=Croceibacterium xixiisoli TaxID=1476466 RepID=A0A6I4TRT1_9SPHN|nr:MarR family transcriptional regulator [Croceibacterium xixiisoli]MXO98574.1 MarR family transcriptional regulator [Croceibacterium xixiisoli]
MVHLENLVSRFAEVYALLMRTADRRMAEQGASLARTKLLLCLNKRGPLRGTDIADLLNQSPRTITEAVDGLEKSGLVQREADPTDRRAKLVRITPEGADAVDKTEPLRRELIEQTFGVLDAAERAELARILDKLAATLQLD